MRVLFGVRPDLRSDSGGDTTQILQTAEHLRTLGVDVVLDDRLALDPSGFDVVHLFHLTRVYETHVQMRSIRAAGRVPIVLSSIYWPTDEYDRLGRFGVERWIVRLAGPRGWSTLQTAAKWMLTTNRDQCRAYRATLRRGVEAQQRDLLAAADAVLPNSQAEADVLTERFGMPAEKLHVVYNGCDAAATTADANEASNERSPDTVLCVGRIEPRKNQLGVVRALRGTKYRLTFVGNAGVYHQRYLQACRDAAGADVRFLTRLERGPLSERYRASAIHVCASWYETPGLVNLEAGLAGCRLVVPDKGSVREYFGDTAAYCDPADGSSIREAVDRAATAPHDSAAVARQVAQFTWQRAAEATLAAYEGMQNTVE